MSLSLQSAQYKALQKETKDENKRKRTAEDTANKKKIDPVKFKEEKKLAKQRKRDWLSVVNAMK